MANELTASDFPFFEVNGALPCRELVTALALAPSGELFAIGDAAGDVQIGRPDSRCILRTYSAEGRVCALVWHVSSGQTFLLAATCSGNFYIWDDNPPISSIIATYTYPHTIHALAVSECATYMAISVGYAVYLYRKPFSREASFDHPFAVFNGPTAQSGYAFFIANPVAIRLEFIDNGILLIGYLAGISLVPLFHPFTPIFKKKTKFPSLLGHFAVSPSKQLVATTNLFNGLDLFSMDKRAFVSNYGYLQTSHSGSTFANRIVHAAFVNNNIIVAGHFEACIFLLAVGEQGVQSCLRVDLPGGDHIKGTQLVAAALINNRRPIIVAVNGEKMFFISLKFMHPTISRPITLQPSALVHRLPREDPNPTNDHTPPSTNPTSITDLAAPSVTDQNLNSGRTDDNVSVSDSETSVQGNQGGAGFWITCTFVIVLAVVWFYCVPQVGITSNVHERVELE